MVAARSLGDLDSKAIILITEVYYDTPGVDDNEEWIEVANLGRASLDLSDHKVGDAAEPGAREGMYRFPSGATIDAGEAIVIAQSSAGFRALYGRVPDYEIRDTETEIPDLETYESWSTGSLALNNDGDEVVLLGPDELIVDAVSYGRSGAFFRPTVNDVPTGQSIERYPAGCDRDLAADWQPQPRPNPGQTASSGPCSPQDAADAGPYSIGQIQGPGSRSPYVNQIVHFRAIITGVLEDRNARGITFYTLFVQDAAEDADGDPATSDAVAVFVGPRRPHVQLGDIVSLSGQVTEFYGLTEIDDDHLSIRVLSSGSPLPVAEPISLAGDGAPSDYERLEAMRVALPEGLVVGPTHVGCGFALADEDHPSARVLSRALKDALVPILPVLHHSDVDCSGFPDVKVGDRVRGLTGPLTYHFDQFKVVHQPSQPLQVVSGPLPPVPEPLKPPSGAFSLATFNLNDYFDVNRDTANDAEPVPAPEEVALKRGKVARVIAGVLGCPGLLGIQEAENAALLRDLAEELASPCGFTYEVSHRESPDPRGIDVALLSNPTRVEVRLVALQQACSDVMVGVPQEAEDCPAGLDPLFARPPLQVDALIDDLPVTIFVTHFKSKRDGESETQWRRIAQARHLQSLLAQGLATGDSARIIVLGDFNDYELSPPLTAITQDAGMVNAMSRVPLPQRYTYNFGGVSQLLDGILLTPTLAEEMVSAQIVHVNADFPASWVDDPDLLWRSSDHDIPVVVLERKPPIAPAPPATASPAEQSTAPTLTEHEPEATAAGPIVRRTTLLLGAVLVASLALSLRLLFLLRR